MPTRLIRLFLLAASLSFTGAAVVALSGVGLKPSSTATVTADARPVAPVDLPTTTLMPTIVVHPDVEVPTLATVTVRPNRAELIDIPVAPAIASSAVSVPLLARRPNAGLMSSAGFDMPYYSFGKTLRHVSKE